MPHNWATGSKGPGMSRTATLTLDFANPAFAQTAAGRVWKDEWPLSQDARMQCCGLLGRLTDGGKRNGLIEIDGP